MNGEILLVCSTFPEAETARRISRQLVSEQLAACANIIPPVESIYRWQGKMEEANETLVFFKTTAATYSAFQDRLRGLHPYEVPEIICWNIAQGLPEYLSWVAANTVAP